MNQGSQAPLRLLLAAGLVFCGSVPCALAAEPQPHWFEQLQRVAFLRDYNTRVVLLGTTLLGISGGIVGVFMLLRRRALIGDVVGHSALPGIGLAFILTRFWTPGAEKNLAWLVAGASVTGLLGALCVLAIDRYSRIKADAALAIVLSLFYGLGTALLTVIQRLPTASAAGLQDYLNGKTAALVAADVWIFAIAALGLIVLTLLLFKELALLCFDEDYAAATGWPVLWLDALLIGLVVGVTIVGMQTVGLILVVAILIIPAASARFWTDNVRQLTLISAVLGGGAAAIGTFFSAMFPRIAAGAVIVLSGSTLFLISLLIGRRRGIVWKGIEARRLRRRIGRHDLLRTIYEQIESRTNDEDIPERQLLNEPVELDALQRGRSWSRARFHQLLRQASADDLLDIQDDGTYSLTPDGAALARRAVRNHRLWELYLITYADIAPSHVDRDADRIEHILGPEMIQELEQRLASQARTGLPASPHRLPDETIPNPESPT